MRSLWVALALACVACAPYAAGPEIDHVHLPPSQVQICPLEGDSSQCMQCHWTGWRLDQAAAVLSEALDRDCFKPPNAMPRRCEKCGCPAHKIGPDGYCTPCADKLRESEEREESSYASRVRARAKM